MNASSVDQNVSGLAVGYGRRMPDGSRDVMPFIDARGMGAATGITSTVEDMAKFVSAQFRKGPRGGRQILSTASLREMHRVRMLENNWTQGNGIGFAVSRMRRQGLRRTRRRLSGLHDPDADPARQQGRRHRPDQHQRLESRRHRPAADEHGRRGGCQSDRRRSRRSSRGIRPGPGLPGSIAAAAATRRWCC